MLSDQMGKKRFLVGWLIFSKLEGKEKSQFSHKIIMQHEKQQLHNLEFKRGKKFLFPLKSAFHQLKVVA